MLKLETRDLSKTFIKATGGEVEALRNINLQIEEGEFICIVGASGCGKTTFLRILDGLIDQTSGNIILAGQEVTRPGPGRGFVFQSASLLPWRTVPDNVVFGLEVQGKPRTPSVERAMDYIKLAGLS